MKVVAVPAAEPIPYGCPVRSTPDGCAISVLLTDMVGVSRRGPAERDHWRKGEAVPVQTDGGIRTDLVADAELTIAGIVHRLTRFDAHYFELSGGKIVSC